MTKILDSTTTDRTRRRLSKALAPLAVLASIAAPVTLATAAQADTGHCGSTKNVRVTIYYKACDDSGTTPGKYFSARSWKNDHGSAVSVTLAEGAIYSGDGVIHWYLPSPSTITVQAGSSQPPAAQHSCISGKSVQYVLQVQQNDGTWGAASYATPVICP